MTDRPRSLWDRNKVIELASQGIESDLVWKKWFNFRWKSKTLLHLDSFLMGANYCRNWKALFKDGLKQKVPAGRPVHLAPIRVPLFCYTVVEPSPARSDEKQREQEGVVFQSIIKETGRPLKSCSYRRTVLKIKVNGGLVAPSVIIWPCQNCPPDEHTWHDFFRGQGDTSGEFA
jgi:hypothetical protein